MLKTNSTSTPPPETVPDNVAEEQQLEETKFSKKPVVFDLYSAFVSLPIAKDIKEELRKISDVMENVTTSFVEVGRVEEVLENDPDSYEDVGVDKETLNRVQPSIYASLAILGMALVVFLAIFIVCKMQQKQKYTYRNTFSRAVFQNPAIAARKLSNSSSLNTIMVNVVAAKTSRLDEFEAKSDIENDSLDGNDSWDSIPDYMK